MEHITDKPESNDQHNAARVIGRLIGITLTMAVLVAAVGVLALACSFAKWAMFG